MTIFRPIPAFFKTSGWIERGQSLEQLGPSPSRRGAEWTRTYDQLVEKYGEDNAKFLYEQLCNMTRNYGKLAFIEMGIEPDDRFERETIRQADERGWKYEKLAGDMGFPLSTWRGRWDDDRFLVVPPGYEVSTRATTSGSSARRSAAKSTCVIRRKSGCYSDSRQASPPRAALRIASRKRRRAAGQAESGYHALINSSRNHASSFSLIVQNRSTARQSKIPVCRTSESRASRELFRQAAHPLFGRNAAGNRGLLLLGGCRSSG